MSSDADYMSTLDKVNNQNTSKPTTEDNDEGTDSKFKPIATFESRNVPPVLTQGLEGQFLVSDADYPFESVSISFEGGKSLDKSTFAELVGLETDDVEQLSVDEWDSRGQYKAVVDAILAATSKDRDDKTAVTVFRVRHDGARAEYFVLCLAGNGTIVGARAKAVEDA